MNQATRVTVGVVVALAIIGVGFYWHATHNVATAPTQTTTPPVAGPAAVPNQDCIPTATSSQNIRVTAPVPCATIGTTLVITGEAREFENTFAWRLRDADGTVLREGTAMAKAPDAGQFGPFEVRTTYRPPHGTHGMVEVFARSPKDGTNIDTVFIPVRF